MARFTKLFNSILHSTIWSESNETRILWITMLAMSEKDGTVMASVPGLAKVAGISLEETVSGLEKFQKPDPFSRTPDHEGRRVEVIEGGWRLLNYGKYKTLMSVEERREYNRLKQKEWRDRNPKKVTGGNKSKPVIDTPPKEKPEHPKMGSKIQEKWNSYPNLTKIRDIGASRMSHLRARAKDKFFIENWEEGIKKVSESNFCTGKNDNAWVATFDWFIKPDSLVRIMEGKYDNRAGTGKPQTEGERDAKNTGFAPIKPKILE